MKKKNIKLNRYVIVYDRYNFAIPLKAKIIKKSNAKNNDGVQIQLLQSNNKFYPIGCLYWVSRRQLRKVN